MELSICIPVYQQKVHYLVQELLEQANLLALDYEILLFDDFSAEEYEDANRKLASLPRVDYREMEVNQGRSKIRNTLAVAARGEFMLFLDNDGEIISRDFLQDYWQAKIVAGLVCGGTAYPVHAPKKCELHFQFGFKREVKNAFVRNQQPYRGFKTNSFLAHSSVFEKIRFDESLKQYGHEDTLFGLGLMKNNISIKHIDNPVLHGQLETNAAFLEKTRQSLQNLHQIAQNLEKQDLDFFPLYKLASQIKESGLATVLQSSFKLSEQKLLKNLLSSRPSLWQFDLYRLGYLLGVSS